MIATALMLPCLTVIDDFIGMFGGWVIAKLVYGLPSLEYWSSTWRALVWNDVGQGLLKPFIFSFAVSLIGSFWGLRTTGGTQGVGRATTQAVVWSSIAIFILDFFIGKMFVSAGSS
jgi:phospholipid/cholesterol/gamma-HCH transport system permease protein